MSRPPLLSRARQQAVAALIAIALPLSAQWLKYPNPAIPRTADGKPNLTAPAPKNDISGLWQPAGLYIGNIAKDLKESDVPMTPWAAELYKHRRDTASKEDPTGWCIPGGVPRSDIVPYPYKIIPAKGMVMILYEAVHSYRQIFTDGRALPKDPNPTWQGYSIGHWEKDGDKDAFVVESNGFVDNSWLDNNGHPGTEQMRVTERFKRKDFGHMDIEVTIDDPKAYTHPWNVTLPMVLVPDTDLLEYVCNDNNKDLQHLVGK